MCGSAHSCWLGIIIIMHGLRLLIAVLQCLLNCLHVSIIRHFIKFCLSTPSSFYMYCLRVFIVVLQELHCLITTIFTMIKCMTLCIPYTSFVSELYPVHELKLKHDNNNNKEKMESCELLF